MGGIFEEMRQSILDGDEELAIELAQQALAEKLDLDMVLDEGFLKGIMEVGALYAEGEFFLPELVCSADAVKSALAILKEEMKLQAAGNRSMGKAVLLTVQGDVHDIGKTIVGAMMTAAGFEVYDLGADVANEQVIRTVKEVKPDILGLSALLTTTMQEQKMIIELLEREGLRNQVKVMVGGAPVSRQWADKIKADGYSDNAMAAVSLAIKLMQN